MKVHVLYYNQKEKREPNKGNSKHNSFLHECIGYLPQL